VSLLRLADRELELAPGRPALMGIVNASPESFSDGGALRTTEARVAHGLRLAAEGAAIVDVGGESGVTHLPAVTVDEEIARAVPVVERLAAAGVTVSIDTWKAPVARAALAAGATMVNDPSGLCDSGVAAACAEHDAALVVTHTGAEPKTKAFPAYGDVLAEVLALLERRTAVARAHGVASDRVAVDPGLDLGKTPPDSVAVLRGLGELHSLGHPVLLAASRKDFVGALTERPPADRLGGTLAAIAAGVEAGAAIVRVHDVAATADYLAVRAAVVGDVAVARELRLPEGLRRQRAAA
jgi:dihydropteroate synthase